MAIVAPTANKEELRERIVAAVQDMYTEVASCPAKGFHFPTGRWACEYVGYPAAELDAIPQTAVESFAGVGYPFRANVLQRGYTVLDIGSGSGTDILITALKFRANSPSDEIEQAFPFGSEGSLHFLVRRRCVNGFLNGCYVIAIRHQRAFSLRRTASSNIVYSGTYAFQKQNPALPRRRAGFG